MREITVATHRRRQLVDITREVADVVDEDGVWLLYVPHTTAGITINEGADPAVAEDILMVLERHCPDDLRYQHREGNSPAHVMSCLIGASALVAVERGKLRLGTWQSVFFCEFDGPRTRKVQLTKV